MSLPKPFTLTPPQLAFATWLAARSCAGSTTRPSRQQQCAMWERLTGEALTLAQLRALRADADFCAALKEARGTAQVQISEAQRIALAMYPAGMQAHSHRPLLVMRQRAGLRPARPDARAHAPPLVQVRREAHRARGPRSGALPQDRDAA